MKNFYRFAWLIGLLMALNTSCRPDYLHSTKRFSKKMAAHPLYQNSFHGVCVYDMDQQRYVIEYNHHKYFTPASTVKLFTFYTALKMLGSELPALEYAVRRDSLIFRGTGNPLLLHPSLPDTAAFAFLKKRPEKLFFSAHNFKDKPLGAGWAWDDYSDYYSAERSPFPLYGNVLSVSYDRNGQITAMPRYFQPVLLRSAGIPAGTVIRDLNANIFRHAGRTANVEVPYLTSPELTAALLGDTLKKTVTLLPATPKVTFTTLYSFPSDSLYRRMLLPSDNFLAEQILLLCASRLPDSAGRELNTQKVINWMMKNHLSDLADPPRWVDGSGLSRMNLFTPHSMVQLLLKIYGQVATSPGGQARLFHLLPVGGRTGTLAGIYKDYPPFIYAKTGTLSNNHNLCGYLVTKSGKRLCFSFMNNHYLETTREMREAMEKILTGFYLNY